MKLLCKTSDIGPGEILAVEVEGLGTLAIYNVDGDFFATDDFCSHGEASLADGEISGCKVICPLHMGSFDIATGKAIDAPCFIDIATFPVQVEGDGVYLAEC